MVSKWTVLPFGITFFSERCYKIRECVGDGIGGRHALHIVD